MTNLRLLAVALLAGTASSFGQAAYTPIPDLDAANVSWDTPGLTSQASMPIGNGDLGLNVWVEQSGDLVFYIGKTDTWTNEYSAQLMKIGGVRVSFSPAPLSTGAPFLQVLKLHESEIDIKEGSGPGEVDLRIWVDANHPVIRVEEKSARPVSIQVTLNDWRKNDVSNQRISPDQTNQVVWYHRNPSKGIEPVLTNITFGAMMKGPGLVSKSDTELDSPAPVTSQLISIIPLTATTDTPEEWLAKLGDLAKQIDALDLEQSRTAHLQWWDAFWHRSWIFARGPKEATDCTEGYVLQRYVTACSGRGAYPIKFNGSIFNVDNPFKKNGVTGQLTPVNADYRDWDGGYWYQNTRAMYWPRLEAGDFDEMMPLFNMYESQTLANIPVVKAYYHHDGSYFAEQRPFWGGLKYVGPETPPSWNDDYFTDILDLGMMMLDYSEYTGDQKYLKEHTVPMITLGLTFFREHFHLGPDGKLLLDNDNSIETYWKATNPAPDIAGLHAVLARMIALPDDVVDAKTRADWVKMQSTLPDLPRAVRNGKEEFLPYGGPQTVKRSNGENPDLYAVYPFRLYGLERPDLPLMIQTFNSRQSKQMGCWSQDPVQAAMLGLTDVAAQYVHYNFVRTDPHLKFPAFWDKGHDYMPDEDNGGNGENGFQEMILQPVGKKLLLFGAWPKNWDVNFKLNAPFQTTVQGRFAGGKLVDLVVNPPERKADVIDMSLRETPAPTPPPVVGEPGTVKSIIAANDPVVPLMQTVKGQPNTLANNAAVNSQGAKYALDGNLKTGFMNRGQDVDGYNPRGDNTGFVVTPSGSDAVTKIQFATGNDNPERDPLAITIEGSNDPHAAAVQGNGYTLLFEGRSGLDIDPGRNQWGPVITFPNTTAYKCYRILVTETRDDHADGTLFSEVRLGN